MSFAGKEQPEAAVTAAVVNTKIVDLLLQNRQPGHHQVQVLQQQPVTCKSTGALQVPGRYS